MKGINNKHVTCKSPLGCIRTIKHILGGSDQNSWDDACTKVLCSLMWQWIQIVVARGAKYDVHDLGICHQILLHSKNCPFWGNVKSGTFSCTSLLNLNASFLHGTKQYFSKSTSIKWMKEVKRLFLQACWIWMHHFYMGTKQYLCKQTSIEWMGEVKCLFLQKLVECGCIILHAIEQYLCKQKSIYWVISHCVRMLTSRTRRKLNAYACLTWFSRLIVVLAGHEWIVESGF